jgi:hypothetical protein
MPRVPQSSYGDNPCPWHLVCAMDIVFSRYIITNLIDAIWLPSPPLMQAGMLLVWLPVDMKTSELFSVFCLIRRSSFA